MESQRLYESLTENAKPVSDKKCIVLTPIAKAAEATDGDEAPAPPRMEDIKIFDSSLCLVDVIRFKDTIESLIQMDNGMISLEA